MKLTEVSVFKYNTIDHLQLFFHPGLNVLYGKNLSGKTSILKSISEALSAIEDLVMYPNLRTMKYQTTNNKINYGYKKDFKIIVKTNKGINWEFPIIERSIQNSPLRQYILDNFLLNDNNSKSNIPIVCFYSSTRQLEVDKRYKISESRFHALQDSMLSVTKYKYLQKMMTMYEKKNKVKDYPKVSNELKTIHNAIENVYYSSPDNPYDEYLYHNHVESHNNQNSNFNFEMYSGGTKSLICMVADLACRMVHANPHLENPLLSEAIVLIDNIELELDPRMAQSILTNLQKTFPRTQFIVTTSSPFVLQTVSSNQVKEVYQDPHRGVVAVGLPSECYGSSVSKVIKEVIKIDEKPPSNPIIDKVIKYKTEIQNNNSNPHLKHTLIELLGEDYNEHTMTIKNATKEKIEKLLQKEKLYDSDYYEIMSINSYSIKYILNHLCFDDSKPLNDYDCVKKVCEYIRDKLTSEKNKFVEFTENILKVEYFQNHGYFLNANLEKEGTNKYPKTKLICTFIDVCYDKDNNNKVKWMTHIGERNVIFKIMSKTYMDSLNNKEQTFVNTND